MQGFSGFIRLLLVHDSANVDKETRDKALLIPTNQEISVYIQRTQGEDQNGDETPDTEVIEENFFFIIVKQIARCNSDYKIEFRGDSVFFWTATWPDFLYFCQNLRRELLKNGYLFKGSISSGQITQKKSRDILQNFSSAFDDEIFQRLCSKVSGYSFDQKTIRLIENEELYKGIGYICDIDPRDSEIENSSFVRSYHQSNRRLRSFSEIVDLAFLRDDIGGPIIFLENSEEDEREAEMEGILPHLRNPFSIDPSQLNPCFWELTESDTTSKRELRYGAPDPVQLCVGIAKQFIKATSLEASYARYYVPLFISIIASSNFSHLRYVEFQNQMRWQAYPVIFDVLYSRNFRVFASKHKEFDIVYAMLFQACFEDNDKELLDDSSALRLVSSFSVSHLHRLIQENSGVLKRSTRDRIVAIQAEMSLN